MKWISYLIIGLSFSLFLITSGNAQEKNKLQSVDQAIQRMHLSVGGMNSTELENAINKNEDLLLKYPNSEFTPNILFQLSELYIKKSRLDYARKMSEYEKQLKDFDSGKTAIEPTLPRINFNDALHYLQELENQYPYISFIDKILYRMALCYQEENNSVKSQEYFDKLISEAPNSPLVAESYFRLAEHYFDDGKYENAIQYYSKLVKKNMWNNNFFDMSLYKLGWTYYKLNKYPEAISNFLFLLKDIEAQERLQSQYLDRSSTDLIDEALQYIAISFSEFGGPEKARDFLLSLGDNRYDDEILKRLGNIFKKQDRLEQAIATYRILLKTFPNVPYAPDIQLNIVACYKQLWDPQKANKEQENLVKNYGLESKWYKETKNDSVRNHARTVVRDALYNVGIFHQLQAREAGGDGEEYRKAIEWYNRFLEDFKDDPSAYKVLYFMAECEYQIGDYESSAENYGQIAHDTSNTEYLEDAAYNTILSYLKAAENYSDGKPVVFEVPRFLAKKDTVRVEVKNLPMKQFILASLEFPHLVKDGARTVEVLLKLADELSKIQRYDLARAAYLTIINNYPESDYYGTTMMLVAQSYFKEEDYNRAEKWYQSVLTALPDSSELVAKAKGMVASSHYKLAEKLRESGKSIQAAKEYATAALKYPNSTIAEMALIQAGKQFEAIGDTVSAAQIYEKFLAKYPDSKLLDKVAVMAAAYREKMKQWDKAASDYLKLVEVNSPLKAKALYFAANCYYKQKDWNKAIDLFSKYITIFDNYNHYVEALFRMGEGYYDLSQPQMALTFLNKALSVYNDHKNENISPYYVANASFLIGEIHFQQYAAIEITSDFAKSLGAKKKYLKICLQDYKRTIDFRVAEWVTASYYEIGRAWEEFANAMINSPLPANLSTEEVAAYQLKLNEAAAPLLKKAAKYFQANLKQAKKNHIDNIWIKKSQNRFASLTQKGVKAK